jgi:hypothetical protein
LRIVRCTLTRPSKTKQSKRHPKGNAVTIHWFASTGIPAFARMTSVGMNRVHYLQMKSGTWFTGWLGWRQGFP